MAGVMCDGCGGQMGHQLMVESVTDPSLNGGEQESLFCSSAATLH